MPEWLTPLHPRVVHFPIALSLVGAVFAAIGLLKREGRWFSYGQLSLLLGGLGTLAAALTGLIDQSAAPQEAAVLAVINQHITAGILLAVAIGLALYWPLRHRQLLNSGCGARWGYLALLLAVVLLVLVSSWLGGTLVYQFGVGVK